MAFNILKTILLIVLLCCSVGLQAQDDWVTLYNQAQQSYNEDNVEESIKKAKICLDAYLQQSGEINGNYRSILRLLTTCAYSQGLINDGIDYGQKEIDVLESMGAPKDLTYADAFYNLGSLYLLATDYPQSQKHLQNTLDIYEQYYTSSDDQLIECKWKLASVHYMQGNSQEASRIYAGSFADYGQRDEVTMDYVQASFDYGSLLIELGQHQQGIPYLLTVEDIYEASGLTDSEDYAGLLTTMADAYQQVDRTKAEHYYAMAIDKYQPFNNEAAIQNITNNRAVNLQAMGQTEQAEALLANSSGDGSDISSLNNRAAINQNNGDYDMAEQLYRQALSLVEDKNSEQFAQVTENMAVLLSVTGRNDQAIKQIDVSLKIIGRLYGEGHWRYSAVRRKKAMILVRQRRFAEAESHYRQAINTLIISGNHKQELARALNGLAVMYKESGNYYSSDSIFAKALTMTESAVGASHPLYNLVLSNLAALKEIKGEHLEAKRLLLLSLAISKENQKALGSAYIAQLENLAAIHTELGEYSEAEGLLTESKAMIESEFTKESNQYAGNLMSFGRLEQVRGRYTEAEPIYAEAAEIIKKLYGKNHPEYAIALHRTALLYQILGNISEAEPLFLRCADIFEQSYGKSHPEYITTIENLSSLYQSKGENDKALPLLEEALAMDAKVYGKEHPAYAITLHNLASLYQRQSQFAKAEPLFLKSLEIDAKAYGEDHRTYANTLYNLGTLYQDMGKYDEAEKALTEAISIREKVLGQDHPDYAHSLYGLAALYHGTQKLDKANTYYHQTIQQYLKQIDEYFPSMSEKEKSAFYSKIKPVFDAFFDFCIDYHREGSTGSRTILSDMYNLQLSTKALLLNASNKVRDRILNSGDTQLINNYREWIGMKEKLVKYFNYSKDELAEQNINIEQLKQQANALEKSLSSMSSEFAQGYEKGRIDWKQVQDKLGPTDAAIEVIRVTKKFAVDSVLYAVLVVNKNMTEEPELVLLDKGNSLETRLFNYYRNAIKYSIGDEISYNNYWGNVADKLEGITRAYFSADGIYNKLNVNTLWDPKTEMSVINELEVRLVSNTRELVEADKQADIELNNIAEVFGFPDFNKGFAVVSSTGKAGVRASTYGFNQGITPLPGTEKEVNHIRKILEENNWKHTIHMGGAATEDNLKKIKSPRLLHLASHGYFMNDITFDDRDRSFDKGYNNLYSNPLLRSGVLLTGSAKAIFTEERTEGEDGVVSAYEAMNLHLDNTDLVILSACETGLGQVRNGEGVYGLQRAFIVAGAKSVIMSLWKVNDITTQELMVNFYQNWLGGMNKYEAFKAAQLNLKNKYNDPYHWGAFVLLGK